MTTTPRCVLCGRPEDEATPSFSWYLSSVGESRCPECGKTQGSDLVDRVDVERELAELRTAVADAASIMSSIYESFRDGEKIDPAVVDIGIGCWLEKHAPGSLPEKDGD